MKKALLVALVMLSASPALAQKEQQIALKQNPTAIVSPRDSVRAKFNAAVTPASKPKVDNIIAILIGLLTATTSGPPTGEIGKSFELTFNQEAKKAFPKADAGQLDTLRSVVTLEVASQLKDRLAERQLRAGVVSALVKCKADNACFEKHTSGINRDKVNAIRKELEGKTKDLESQDKMGNFEIQDLMSRYNQAETLASSVQKKDSDTQGAVISKI